MLPALARFKLSARGACVAMKSIKRCRGCHCMISPPGSAADEDPVWGPVWGLQEGVWQEELADG